MRLNPACIRFIRVFSAPWCYFCPFPASIAEFAAYGPTYASHTALFASYLNDSEANWALSHTLHTPHTLGVPHLSHKFASKNVIVISDSVFLHRETRSCRRNPLVFVRFERETAVHLLNVKLERGRTEKRCLKRRGNDRRTYQFLASKIKKIKKKIEHRTQILLQHSPRIYNALQYATYLFSKIYNLKFRFFVLYYLRSRPLAPTVAR